MKLETLDLRGNHFDEYPQELMTLADSLQNLKIDDDAPAFVKNLQQRADENRKKAEQARKLNE